MTSENPYDAPSATLGTTAAPLDGDLAAAVEDFIVTRRFVRVLAILSLIVLVFSVLGLGAQAMAPSPVSKSMQAVSMASIVFMYGLFGVIAFRLSTALYALAEQKTWANVTFVFERLTQAWIGGVSAFVVMLVGGVAMRFMAPMAVIAGMQLEPADAVSAARRLRSTLRIFVGVSVFSVVLNVVLTAFAPMPSQLLLGPTFMWGTVLGGAIVQAIMLVFVWRHVPALEEFVAQPSSTTLAKVAHAHRMLVRLGWVMILLVVAFAVVGVVAAIAISSMFGRHK